MDAQDIITTLRRHEADLRARGIATADSNIDILIDLAPGAAPDVYSYVGLKTFVADLFCGPVDVIDRDCLRKNLRPEAERDAVYAF